MLSAIAPAHGKTRLVKSYNIVNMDERPDQRRTNGFNQQLECKGLRNAKSVFDYFQIGFPTNLIVDEMCPVVPELWQIADEVPLY